MDLTMKQAMKKLQVGNTWTSCKKTAGKQTHRPDHHAGHEKPTGKHHQLGH